MKRPPEAMIPVMGPPPEDIRSRLWLVAAPVLAVTDGCQLPHNWKARVHLAGPNHRAAAALKNLPDSSTHSHIK
jgi:hypothetical protein